MPFMVAGFGGYGRKFSLGSTSIDSIYFKIILLFSNSKGRSIDVKNMSESDLEIVKNTFVVYKIL